MGRGPAPQEPGPDLKKCVRSTLPPSYSYKVCPVRRDPDRGLWERPKHKTENLPAHLTSTWHPPTLDEDMERVTPRGPPPVSRGQWPSQGSSSSGSARAHGAPHKAPASLQWPSAHPCPVTCPHHVPPGCNHRGSGWHAPCPPAGQRWVMGTPPPVSAATPRVEMAS